MTTDLTAWLGGTDLTDEPSSTLAEAQVVDEIRQVEVRATRVAIDLTRVFAVDDVGRRILLEVVRRLTLDGCELYLIDPEVTVPDPDPGDGGRVTVIASRDQLSA